MLYLWHLSVAAEERAGSSAYQLGMVRSLTNEIALQLRRCTLSQTDPRFVSSPTKPFEQGVSLLSVLSAVCSCHNLLVFGSHESLCKATDECSAVPAVGLHIALLMRPMANHQGRPSVHCRVRRGQHRQDGLHS